MTVSLKQQRVLVRAAAPTEGPVIESFLSHQKFIGTLVSGTSAVIEVEASQNGVTNWVGVATFTLDTPGEAVTSQLLVTPMPYLRATITAISGPSALAHLYMGA